LLQQLPSRPSPTEARRLFRPPALFSRPHPFLWEPSRPQDQWVCQSRALPALEQRVPPQLLNGSERRRWGIHLRSHRFPTDRVSEVKKGKKSESVRQRSFPRHNFLANMWLLDVAQQADVQDLALRQETDRPSCNFCRGEANSSDFRPCVERKLSLRPPEMREAKLAPSRKFQFTPRPGTVFAVGGRSLRKPVRTIRIKSTRAGRSRPSCEHLRTRHSRRS